MARKTVNLTLVAEYTPEPDPPEPNAELSLGSASYTVSEGDTVDIIIQRGIRTDQVIDVDWAALNASVLPVSGTARFSLGESQKTITLTAQQVDTDEQGSFQLSNPQYVSGPVSDPILVTPSTAALNVNDLGIPSETDFPPYADPLDGVTISGGRNIVLVSNDTEFGNAIAAAQAGDTIRLQAGNYSVNQTITAKGTPTEPIIIEGADGFLSKWDGRLRLEGEYNYVIGLDCSLGSQGRVILSGYTNKILGCKFGNQEAANAISLDRVVDVPNNRGGRYGEIAYCDFDEQGPNPPWSPGDDFPGFRQQIKMFTDGTYNPSADKWGWDSVHIDGWIHHNHFHDSHPKADPQTYSSGDNDIIEFGEGESQEFIYTLSSNWYVEYNLFKNNNNQGNTLVDFKTRGNVCRGNTGIGNFNNSFWSRTGGAITYISNWLDYTWGRPQLILRDADNIAVKNYMDGGQIDDMAGDRPANTYPVGSWGPYPCAKNSKLISNTGGCEIHVGEKNSNQGDLPGKPENTLIEDHAGGVSFRSVDGVPQYINPIDRRNEPPSLIADDPVQLTESDVGPAAMDNAPIAYRNARIP